MIVLDKVKSIRNDIQVLRAVAVLLVVFGHFYFQSVGLTYSWGEGTAVGVDIFFVISGFLITGLLIKENDVKGRISLTGFYARRIKRIMPAATLVSLVALLLAFLLFRQSGVSIYEEGFWAAIFGLNWHYVLGSGSDYFNNLGTSSFTHYWSLAVEEQFYFVWPLLVILAVKAGSKFNQKRVLNFMLAVIIVSSILVHIYTILTDPGASYYNAFGRAWELAVGSLVAVNSVWLKDKLSHLSDSIRLYGLILMISPVILFDAMSFNNPMWPFAAVVGSAMVIVAGINVESDALEGFWNNKFLVWVGEISFSLYLWHSVILMNLVWWYGDLLPLGLSVAAIFVSFAAAHFSTKYVENPIRYNKWLDVKAFGNLNRTHLFGVIMVVLGLVVSSLLMSYSKTSPVDGSNVSSSSLQESINMSVSDSYDRRYHSEVYPQPYVLGSDRTATFKDGCFKEYDIDGSEPCFYGDLKSDKTVAVFGDSQAGMWMDNLDRWGEENGYKIQAWTKSACPPYDAKFYSMQMNRAYVECDAWRVSVIEQIKASSADVVFLDGGFFIAHADSKGNISDDLKTHDKRLVAGYNSVIAKFETAGKRVILLGPIPNANFDIDALKSERNLDSLQLAEKVASGRHFESLEIAKKISNQNDVTLVDFTDMFCNETVCPIIVDNMMVYMDPRHVSKTYAGYVYNLFEDKLNDAFRLSYVK